MKTLGTLQVADAYDSDVSPVMQVRPTDDFAEVIESFSSRSETRAIFVVESDGQLVGVITRNDILDWSRAKLGAFFTVSRAQGEDTIRVASLVHATLVSDVMHASSAHASVQTHDSLQSALRLMLELELIALAVVDAEGRIAGQLSLSHILSTALRTTKASE